MKRRISQKQIAADLGVSQSLVSLVLNGRRDGISEASYQRIWSHAVKSGYAPKGMLLDHAPGQELEGSYVGVVLRAGIKLATQSNTFSHVNQGLYRVHRKVGISTAFLGTEGDLDEAEFLRLLQHRNPLRGIVICGEVQSGFIKAIAELQQEVVSVYASYPGLCHSVLPNERQAVEQIVTHLRGSLGHTRFAWLGGNRALGRNQARLQALREALHLRDVDLKEEAIVNMSGGDRQDGYDGAKKLMTQIGRREKPTAWICHNGLMARGALQFALQRGIRIPQDVSLVAIDMTRVCEEMHPYLTSASSNPERIGEKAAEVLFHPPRAGEERVFSDLVLPSSLVVRESCGRAPGKKRRK
jgi:LacI family transcriptional regulator